MVLLLWDRVNVMVALSIWMYYVPFNSKYGIKNFPLLIMPLLHNLRTPIRRNPGKIHLSQR